MYKVPFKVDLSKKVIAITGAGGIICGEFARALSACGAKVALLDINYEAAKKVADEIGENAFAVKCNCLDKEDIKAAKAAVNVYPLSRHSKKASPVTARGIVFPNTST